MKIRPTGLMSLIIILGIAVCGVAQASSEDQEKTATAEAQASPEENESVAELVAGSDQPEANRDNSLASHEGSKKSNVAPIISRTESAERSSRTLATTADVMRIGDVEIRLVQADQDRGEVAPDPPNDIFQLRKTLQLATEPEELAEPDVGARMDAPTEPDLITDVPWDSCCGTPGWLWMFGIESTFLFPDSNSVGVRSTVAVPNTTSRQLEDSTMHFGPRVWLGIDHGRWAILGRFWHQNGASQDVTPFAPGTRQAGLIRESAIEAYTVDVELSRRFCCGPCWNFEIGGGYRYASLENTGYLSLTRSEETIPGAVISSNGFALTQIDGSGVSGFVGGNRPLHLFCCSWLNFYWKARTTMVWGGIDSAAQTSVLATDPTGPAISNRIDAASARTSDELVIAELQAGFRWEHCLKCAPAVAFFSFGFEYQWWDADGGFAEARSTAAVNEHFGSAIAVAGPDIEFNLIGFTAAAGLTW